MTTRTSYAHVRTARSRIAAGPSASCDSGRQQRASYCGVIQRRATCPVHDCATAKCTTCTTTTTTKHPQVSAGACFVVNSRRNNHPHSCCYCCCSGSLAAGGQKSVAITCGGCRRNGGGGGGDEKDAAKSCASPVTCAKSPQVLPTAASLTGAAAQQPQVENVNGDKPHHAVRQTVSSGRILAASNDEMIAQSCRLLSSKHRRQAAEGDSNHRDDDRYRIEDKTTVSDRKQSSAAGNQQQPSGEDKRKTARRLRRRSYDVTSEQRQQIRRTSCCGNSSSNNNNKVMSSSKQTEEECAKCQRVARWSLAADLQEINDEPRVNDRNHRSHQSSYHRSSQGPTLGSEVGREMNERISAKYNDNANANGNRTGSCGKSDNNNRLSAAQPSSKQQLVIGQRKVLAKNHDYNDEDEVEISSLSEDDDDDDSKDGGDECRSAISSLSSLQPEVGVNRAVNSRATAQKATSIKRASVRMLRLARMRRVPSRADEACPGRQPKLQQQQQQLPPVQRRRPAPVPPCLAGSGGVAGENIARQQGADKAQQQVNANLVSEAEALKLELFLKSHKSAVYVCGCMANLYLTETQLVDNGRRSKPDANGWQLQHTGVPALTFDSGLAKNRSKRRLSIALAERGSGFILWSDTIDHLSNYRAYTTTDSNDNGSNNESHPSARRRTTNDRAEEEEEQALVCETFHIMYLSTNHRIMVGLSFDEPVCARLFLTQIEMVTSDPRNISLTGPKQSLLIAHRRKQHQKKMMHVNKIQVNSRSNSNRLSLRTTPGRSPLARLFHIGSKRMQQQARIKPGGQEGTGDPSPLAMWSTLRRAMRLGGVVRAGQLPAGARAPAGPHADEQDQAGIAGVFRPRPLAEVATAGCSRSGAASGAGTKKNKASKGSAKGLACLRKCDISAPCLFQHVTSVDSASLAQLQSHCLVGSSNGQIKPPDQAAGTGAAENEVRVNVQVNADTGAAIMVEEPKLMISASKSASSSSCYSSASQSPASSECGAAEVRSKSLNEALQMRVAGQAPSPGQVRPASESSKGLQPRQQQRALPPRPSVAPPRVPQRREVLSEQQQQQQVVTAKLTNGVTYAERTPVASKDEGAGGKIETIIRELQAQTSAELVDAKRKLLADISGRFQLLAAAGASVNSSPTATAKVAQVASDIRGNDRDRRADSVDSFDDSFDERHSSSTSSRL